MEPGRLLIVSNRLPISAASGPGGVRLTPSSGGLATGLRPWHERSGGLWIGWPGDVSWAGAAELEGLQRALRERGIVPVHLSRDQVDRFYHGFANRVLWPVFHYLIDRVPVDPARWQAYEDANHAFADVVCREYREGDSIWVHDYQLLRLPALLRKRLPHATIGLFLHIPFPSSEVFRILPWRHALLEGMLGADLIGFHTHSYLRHFLASLLHVDGVEVDLDTVDVNGRQVRLGAFPMGVDVAAFEALARDPSVDAEVAAIRRDAGERQILLGIDRLDYTKGIPRRLQAVKRMFEREPSLADRIRFIQVAVPSRGEVEGYQHFRREVEERVGQINGAFGTLRSTPVHYVHRSISQRQLVALYRAADVMLVTPLRDGMNLVAKEFVASRVDGDGVLILSEFAGAAAELGAALVINPYDVDTVAATISRALTMAAGERTSRMGAMRRRVRSADVHSWARRFIEQLHNGGAARAAAGGSVSAPSLTSVLAAARGHGKILLLLDYDGTLVPIARTPELAAPDNALLRLLTALSAAPDMAVQIVSGRPHDVLERWFGHLPIALWAEHGLWFRPSGGGWQATAAVPTESLERIRPILAQFTEATPGSRIEAKSASLAWHYRGVPGEFGRRQAHELRMLLGDALSNQPFEVLEGKKVIEIRLRGVSKALVGQHAARAFPPETTIVAIGDDRTDADLFQALPPSSVTVAVGHHPGRARYRLADCAAVRELLQALVVVRPDGPVHAGSPANSEP